MTHCNETVPKTFSHLQTIFDLISKCFELLDCSVVIFGYTMCFRTAILDEQPSHIQCLKDPSLQRALKKIVMTLDIIYCYKP